MISESTGVMTACALFSQYPLGAHSEPGGGPKYWEHNDGQDIVPVLEDLTVYEEGGGWGGPTQVIFMPSLGMR